MCLPEFPNYENYHSNRPRRPYSPPTWPDRTFSCPWFCDHGGFLLTNHALLDDGYMAWLKFELCHVRGKITFFLGQNMALVLSAIYVTVESQNGLLETRFYLESSSLFLLLLLLLLLLGGGGGSLLGEAAGGGK